MSARDSESGSSSYKGGSGNAGGLGNGGVGGGMGGGHRGGGAGYNGGIGSRTGMSTGKDWYGNTAFGRPGGMATGYAMRDAASLRAAGMGPTMGSFGQFRTLQGNAMFPGLNNPGMSMRGMNAQQAAQALASLQQQQMAARQPGVIGRLQNGTVPTPAAAPPPQAAVPPPQQRIIGYLPGWPGTGMWWGNQPPYQNNAGLNAPLRNPQQGPIGGGKFQDRVPQDPNFSGNFTGWGRNG